MKLIHTRTREELQIGEVVQTFKGENVTIVRMSKPHKPSSTGRVVLRFEDGYEQGYFPGVIDAEWVTRRLKGGGVK